MSDQKPTPGRIVHYILPDGDNTGEVRPALVVTAKGDTCTLEVFADRANDGPAYEAGNVQRADVEQGKEPGNWCWPPAAPAPKKKEA